MSNAEPVRYSYSTGPRPARVERRLSRLDGVSTGILDGEHQAVCSADEILGWLLTPPQRDPTGAGLRVGHGLDEPLGQRDALVEVAARRDDGELLPAAADQPIAVAEGCGPTLGAAPQEVVSRDLAG